MRAGMAGRGGRDLFCQQSALASRDYQGPVVENRFLEICQFRPSVRWKFCGENIIFYIQDWLIMIRIQRRRGIWLIGVSTTHLGTGMGTGHRLSTKKFAINNFKLHF